MSAGDKPLASAGKAAFGLAGEAVPPALRLLLPVVPLAAGTLYTVGEELKTESGSEDGG